MTVPATSEHGTTYMTIHHLAGTWYIIAGTLLAQFLNLTLLDFMKENKH